MNRERQLEVNQNDMMQNTGICYHPESISEMQLTILSLIWAYCLNVATVPSHLNEHEEQILETIIALKFMLTCLIVRHVNSWFIELMRRYEIEHYGKLDMHGVPRAKYESYLQSVQYFYICVLLGVIGNKLIAIDRTILNFELQMCVLWIIVDLSTCFLTRIYISLIYYLKISGEIRANFTTMISVQKRFLRVEGILNSKRFGLFE